MIKGSIKIEGTGSALMTLDPHMILERIRIVSLAGSPGSASPSEDKIEWIQRLRSERRWYSPRTWFDEVAWEVELVWDVLGPYEVHYRVDYRPDYRG
jgi:hypothetical protein